MKKGRANSWQHGILAPPLINIVKVGQPTVKARGLGSICRGEDDIG